MSPFDLMRYAVTANGRRYNSKVLVWVYNWALGKSTKGVVQ
jgi:hypothetical protein